MRQFVTIYHIDEFENTRRFIREIPGDVPLLPGDFILIEQDWYPLEFKVEYREYDPDANVLYLFLLEYNELDPSGTEPMLGLDPLISIRNFITWIVEHGGFTETEKPY